MIKKFREYTQQRKDIKKELISNKDLLVSGEYIFDKSLRYLYLNDETVSEKASQMFDNYPVNRKTHLVKLLLRTLFFNKSITISETSSQFNGNLFLPSHTSLNKDFKVFDFYENLVLSKFHSKENYRNKVEKHTIMDRYLTSPSATSTDDDQLITVEKLIDFKSNSDWTTEDYSLVMNDLFLNLNRYLGHCKNNEHYSSRTPRELLAKLPENEEGISFLKDHIDTKLLDIKLPFIELHGDLWTPNILIERDKREIYYIDFEDSSEFIFFYDVFSLFYTEDKYNKNSFYIDKYFSGDFDEDLISLFEAYSLKFDPRYRLDYLNLFFLNRFDDRHENWDKEKRLESAEIYKKYNERFKFGMLN